MSVQLLSDTPIGFKVIRYVAKESLNTPASGWECRGSRHRNTLICKSCAYLTLRFRGSALQLVYLYAQETNRRYNFLVGKLVIDVFFRRSTYLPSWSWKFIVGAEPSIKFKPAKSQGIWLHLRTLQQQVTEYLLRRGRSQFMFPLKETAFKNRKEASSFETDDWILELLWLERHLVQYMHWQKKTTTDLYLSQKQTTCWKQQQFCYDGTKVNLIRRKLVVYISKISGEK